MELVTMHTHTNYTGHGHGTVAELVDAAEAAKLGAIAVTEHYPMSAAMDPDNVVSMAWDRLPDYLIDVAAAAAAHPEMQMGLRRPGSGGALARRGRRFGMASLLRGVVPGRQLH